MRKRRPVSLLLVGVVACTTQHSGTTDVPSAEIVDATPPASVDAQAPAGHLQAPTGQPQAPHGITFTSAPPLQGTLPDGETFDLRELRGHRVVLIFYRTAYCGLCTRHLLRLSADMETYRRLKTKIIAITPDPIELVDRTARQLDLDFPIVAVDRATLIRWGVWPDHARTPRPAVFILDGDGELLFHQVGSSAADRVSDATIIFTLRSLDARQVANRGS